MKKRPEKYREITIDSECWNTYVSVMIGGDRRQRRALLYRCKVGDDAADRWLDHMRDLDPRGAVTMYDDVGTPGNVFVYFPTIPKNTDPQDLGSVTHEMLHVTNRILRQKRVTLCHESEEAFTYLTEYLVRELWAQVLRMKCIRD